LITHASDSLASKAPVSVHDSVCLYVSVFIITEKLMIPKSSNLVKGMTLGYPSSDMVLG